MKIMHVIPTLATAGAENFVVSLANEQSKTEEVTILTLSPPTDNMFLRNKISSQVKLISLDKKPGMDLSILWKVLQVFRREAPDIINTHLRSIYYTSLAQILLRIRSFHTIHNMAEREVGASYRKLLGVLFNRFGFIPVSISKSVRESVSLLYGAPHTVLIENGIPEPTTTQLLSETEKAFKNYKKSPETKVLINIGRISPQKNQAMLINTVDRMIAAGNDIVLLILGDFHEEGDKIRRLVRRLNHDRVQLLGIQPNVADYLYCGDLFCLSSIHEGLPLTLLEAMAMGTLPVCTPVGGIPDVLEQEKTGFLSNSTDAKDYEIALNSALNVSERKKNEMIKSMQQVFQTRYAISRCSRNYINAYQSELGQH